jgi:hypothetical protein
MAFGTLSLPPLGFASAFASLTASGRASAWLFAALDLLADCDALAWEPTP